MSINDFYIGTLFDEIEHSDYWEPVGGESVRPPGSAPHVPPSVESLPVNDLVHIQNEALKWQSYANGKAIHLHYQEKMAEERATQLKAQLRRNMSGSAADKADKLRDNVAYMIEYSRAEQLKLEKEKFQGLESRMKAIIEMCYRATMARRET